MSVRKVLLPALPVVGFFLIWQALAQSNIINSALFPPPSKIAQEMAALYGQHVDGGSVLLQNILSTLSRLGLASVEGISAGIAAGVLMGLSRRAFRFFDPLITLVMPIPGIAMAPLFIVWLGFGSPTIIIVGAIAAFFPVVYNTAAGIRSVDMQLVKAARIMGASPIRMLFQVYLPWAVVYVFNGVKLGLARSWRTVVAVEFIAAADWGMGYMIWDAAEYLRAGVVYGGIILLGLMFMAVEKGLIVPFEKITVEKWGMIRS